MQKFKLVKRAGVLVSAVALPVVSQATVAVTAVEAAETSALLVAGAMTGLAIAVWAALYIKRKFFG